jgi:hypothetical protein
MIATRLVLFRTARIVCRNGYYWLRREVNLIKDNKIFAFNISSGVNILCIMVYVASLDQGCE